MLFLVVPWSVFKKWLSQGGGYPAGVKSADWYVNDKKGNKVIIQAIK
jgi:hypothetical protein